MMNGKKTAAKKTAATKKSTSKKTTTKKYAMGGDVPFVPPEPTQAYLPSARNTSLAMPMPYMPSPSVYPAGPMGQQLLNNDALKQQEIMAQQKMMVKKAMEARGMLTPVTAQQEAASRAVKLPEQVAAQKAQGMLTPATVQQPVASRAVKSPDQVAAQKARVAAVRERSKQMKAARTGAPTMMAKGGAVKKTVTKGKKK